MRLPWRAIRVMGCTRVEFVRWWHSFTQDKNDFAAQNQASVVVGENRVQFAIEELDPRRLGLAVIPQLKVSITFPDYESDEAIAWVAKFDHYTQRGGG